MSDKQSWTDRLFGGFRKTSEKLTSNLTEVVGTARLDDATLNDVEDALILSDLGPAAAARIREKLRDAGIGDRVKLHEVPLGGTIDLDPFHIEMVTITHSTAEPNGLAITTPLGLVLHTGDWKLDCDPKIGPTTDEAALIRVGEETGQLAEMLLKVADIYDQEVRRAMERMLAALVPGLTIVLGLLIAGIIGSILAAILSVYELPL